MSSFSKKNSSVISNLNDSSLSSPGRKRITIQRSSKAYAPSDSDNLTSKLGNRLPINQFRSDKFQKLNMRESVMNLKAQKEQIANMALGG